ncbi:hypothetical protein [Baekduia sp.]|uniref:hypothetical protein n=1 Tax=Baekduia sp. TaxID=2600305 RepID=UPI002DFBD794|nr:hypothetical protein [Baekduia sp.]
MTRARAAAVAVLGLRVVYGVGLVAAPERLARRWLGPSAATPPTQVPLRALGAREAILHGGAIAAVLSGRPVRPWLAASIVGDLSDIASTVAGRGGLPGEAPAATAVVAGASAAISAVVALAVDA